ncbi:MAG: serine hydrolase domain-containing protein [Phycisphaeraceae bacterium]
MLQTVQSLIQQGIDDQLHLGAQVCVSRGGEVIEELALGQATLNSTACECGANESAAESGSSGTAFTCGAMTTDSIALWMSSGKPVTAVAILQLVEHGEIALDDAVAEFLPTFACHGKQGITVRHLLTHTAGVRNADYRFPNDDWDTIIAAICDARPEWEPGEKGGYHTQTTWFLLGELVRLVDGRAIDQYVREEIFLPLGMNDSWLGMPPGVFRGYEQDGRLFAMPNTASGESKPSPMMRFDWSTRPRPGGNCMGPIRELVMFYEMLLGGGKRDGVRILQPDTVRQMTHRQRADLHDETFKQTVDWGLGVSINSAHHAPNGAWHRIPYGYGPHASADTFGHGGAQSSVAFADPEHRLAVGIVFNGMPGEAKHQLRVNALLEGLYVDLGLAL